MSRSAVSFFRYFAPALIVIIATVDSGAQPSTTQPLSVNDVSWLFPPPKRVEDLGNLISMRDLTTPNDQDSTKRDTVWSDEGFHRFLEIAAGQSQVAGTQSRIGVPDEATSIANWFIAGIRIDAGAPGLSNEIQAQFGQSPEIRLIVQPVKRNADGTVVVDDVAGHLIFDFTSGHDASSQADCLPRPKPDAVAFKAIIAELDALRTRLSNGQLGANRVSTASAPLGVHPGLLDSTTAQNLRREMQLFLEKNISSRNLDAMAIMGLPAGAPEPWIFLSMQKVPAGVVPALPNGGFVPVAGPTLDGQQVAQMLRAGFSVVPEPHTNNLNAITCKNAAVPPGTSLPIAARNGHSTSELFANPSLPANSAKDILDLIADPMKSHFFNTDCISCHTETRRAMTLPQTTDFSRINASVLPNSDWVVRNFGWAPNSEGLRAVVTRRTANETAAVVDYINSQLLNK
jgi:hypothetical protein